MRHDKTGNPDGTTELCKPVQAFDSANALNRIKDEKAYEDHGRSVLILSHEPFPRLVLTAITAGRRTGEWRVAGASTVQVVECEVRLRAGEERHVLSAGETLVLQCNVSYDMEAMSDAAFLHTPCSRSSRDKASRNRRTRWSPPRAARTWISPGPTRFRAATFRNTAECARKSWRSVGSRESRK